MKKKKYGKPIQILNRRRDLPGAQSLPKVNQSNLVLGLQLTSRFHSREVKGRKP